MKTSKRDNGNLEAKLALRRSYLTRFHANGCRVLDCCQGEGVIWKTLSKEFNVTEYVGYDLKPSKGRLRVDSVRILETAGWEADVVDIDTYGSPWKHWCVLLRTCQSEALTVFLTVGMVKIMGGRADAKVAEMAGCTIRLPSGIGSRLNDNALRWAELESDRMGWQIEDMHEAFPSQNVRYIAARIIRKQP